LFPWAKFRKTKAAVKLHTLLALQGNFPTLVIITPGKVHDVRLHHPLWRGVRGLIDGIREVRMVTGWHMSTMNDCVIQQR